MKDIRAVYFDLDDTLCAYWAASRRALRQAIEEAGLKTATEDAVQAWRDVFPAFSKEIKTDAWYAHYLESGEPTRTEHIRRTLTAIGEFDESLASRISARYAELRNEYLQLFPDALPVLNTLRGKYRLGLITNGPADIQRQEIARLAIEDYFEHILIEGEFKIGKPNRAIFEEAVAESGLKPEQMLFVGNAYEHDVQGAKNAGWWALWLNRGCEPRNDTPPYPDAEIHHLYEICDWLGIDRPDDTAPTPEPELVKNWRG